jgi:hypothetical protein
MDKSFTDLSAKPARVMGWSFAGKAAKPSDRILEQYGVNRPPAAQGFDHQFAIDTVGMP